MSNIVTQEERAAATARLVRAMSRLGDKDEQSAKIGIARRLVDHWYADHIPTVLVKLERVGVIQIKDTPCSCQQTTQEIA